MEIDIAISKEYNRIFFISQDKELCLYQGYNSDLDDEDVEEIITVLKRGLEFGVQCASGEQVNFTRI